MIKVDNCDIWGFEHAIRGMRNPLNSWDRSDSMPGGEAGYQIGENDLDLMHRLYSAGSEHRKYLRQIMVSMDITAPLYWWKEFDTYKVGTTANSCSTMHKIHAKEFELDDFSHEHLTENSKLTMQVTIDMMNAYRDKYLKDKEREDWWQMIQLLPSSYNQKRTVTMNYENVMNMINQRKNHKLDEWKDFVKTLKKLPYIEDIRGGI
jgi:hypothetical protein